MSIGRAEMALRIYVALLAADAATGALPAGPEQVKTLAKDIARDALIHADVLLAALKEGS